ncbi:transposase [Breznakia pachnodae]|uniref:Transposase n=1 Tax=Breznakia pachnodae TaxID=265178 RepID=A0ABU0E8S0_9FIRM|nr:transposase [Breznakia pachnodae]MDQ0363299.1 transposase [Breznakia pachnodae]
MIERFESASKLCAYAGIDPTVHSSGMCDGQHLSIIKKGNYRLRCLLSLVVAGTSKSKAVNNEVRDFVQKKKNDGLAPKVRWLSSLVVQNLQDTYSQYTQMGLYFV